MNLSVGNIVTLSAKSKKGKERIRSLGDRWKIVVIADRVQFDMKPGPWLFVRSLKGLTDSTRWVHSTEDQHFEVAA